MICSARLGIRLYIPTGLMSRQAGEKPETILKEI